MITDNDNEDSACRILGLVEHDIDELGGTPCGITCYLWYRPKYSLPWTVGIEHNDEPVCLISGQDPDSVLQSWERCGRLDVERIVRFETEMAIKHRWSGK